MIKDEFVKTFLGHDPSEPMSGEFMRRVKTLSDREKMVLVLFWAGLTAKETAERLHNSCRTVEVQRRKASEKLGFPIGQTLLAFVEIGLIREAEELINWTWFRLQHPNDKYPIPEELE